MKKKRLFSAILICSFMLAGCGAIQTEDENLILVQPDEAQSEYSMTTVSVGNVEKMRRVKSTYEYVEDVDMTFSVSGKVVKKVYVELGEKVTKGQVLAELDIGEFDSEIRDLKYKIARNELLLSYVEENEDNEISSKWLDYIYGSNQSDEAEEKLKNSIAELQQKNEYSREDYLDAIAMDTLELQGILEDVENSYLYAEANGTISFIESNLEGKTSDEDKTVMSIVEGTQCLFVATDLTYLPYFTEDTEVTISITTGVARGDYKLKPYKIEEWEDRMLFTFADETAMPAIVAGTSGYLKVIVEKREGVLTIPTRAVHTADEKYYVYVVGEGGVRDVKWIEVGLYGDTNAEVVSGLAEGEKVIVK